MPFMCETEQNRMCCVKIVMTIIDTILTTWLQDGIWSMHSGVIEDLNFGCDTVVSDVLKDRVAFM